MTNIPALIKANGARWAACTIPAVFVPALDSTAHRLCAAAAKAQYLDVATKTTVPWFIIAVIHEREASQSWKANLSQGDPWDKVSIHQHFQPPAEIERPIGPRRVCPPLLHKNEDALHRGSQGLHRGPLGKPATISCASSVDGVQYEVPVSSPGASLSNGCSMPRSRRTGTPTTT